jgi:hypothetical protein
MNPMASCQRVSLTTSNISVASTSLHQLRAKIPAFHRKNQEQEGEKNNILDFLLY